MKNQLDSLIGIYVAAYNRTGRRLIGGELSFSIVDGLYHISETLPTGGMVDFSFVPSSVRHIENGILHCDCI